MHQQQQRPLNYSPLLLYNNNNSNDSINRKFVILNKNQAPRLQQQPFYFLDYFHSECMSVCVRVCVGSFLFFCLMIRTVNTTYSSSSSYSETVFCKQRKLILFVLSFSFTYFSVVFLLLFLLFICYFSSLTHVCFVRLKLNFPVLTVLLWPSVFYLALVVDVVVVKTKRNDEKKTLSITRKKTNCRDYRI